MWVNLSQVGSGSYCVEALHQTQKDSAEIQHEPWEGVERRRGQKGHQS